MIKYTLERRNEQNMIRLGYDDDESNIQFDEETGEPIVNHGEGYDPNKVKEIKPVFIPQHRIDEFMKDMDCVVVHDFGDEYHLSEEQREQKNHFYHAFKVVRRNKKKYKRLNEYVTAVRAVLKCLDMVAEENGIYEPDKFKQLFVEGKIFINGLKFPEYNGRDKKTISWEYLTEFILSDADPIDILPKQTDDILSVEEMEEEEKLLFDDGELERILQEPTEEEKIKQNKFFDKSEDDQEGLGIAVILSKKETKRLIKTQDEFLIQLKEEKRRKRSLNNLSRYAYDLTADDIEEIAKYDEIHGYVSSAKIPEFKGDMMNDEDYHRYMAELEEYENTQIKENYNGRLKTREEINEIQLKSVLEENGWNIRNLYENKEKEARLKRAQKEDKRREKKIKEKLVSIQERRKRRMGEDVDDEPSKKKKKKKKKEKPKKDKGKERYKKEVEENIDEFLLTAAQRTEADMDKYEEEALDFSWDNILNGGK